MSTDAIDTTAEPLAAGPDRTAGDADATRIRVCHVSLTLATGGLERLLADFSRFHDVGRCELEFLAITETGRFAREIQDAGHRVHQLTASTRLGRLREMSRFFRERRFDVVHTHNTWPHIYATPAARLAGVPFVVNTRHGQRWGHGRRSRLMYRLASRLADRLVAVSDDAARLCVDVDGVPPEKVVRIHNGIDAERVESRELRVESDSAFEPSSSTRPVAICVARLSAEKDFPTLLRAAALVARRMPGFRLLIVGDGAERDRLETLRNEMGLHECVEFLGERSDVFELLARADFFVLSSLSEGISLTLLEALAAGLPVVTTSVGGNPEVVEEGVTGRLVPPQDPDALAEAIVDVCGDADARREMGECGRRRVADHFDVRRMVAEYEALYAEMLGSRALRATEHRTSNVERPTLNAEQSESLLRCSKVDVQRSTFIEH